MLNSLVGILQEISLAKSPAFLIGDRLVSWRAILRLVRCLEEFKDNESDHFPPQYRAAIAELPLGSCYELLRELLRRKQSVGLPMESGRNGSIYTGISDSDSNCVDATGVAATTKEARLVWQTT